MNNIFIKNPVAIIDRDVTYTVTATTVAGCITKDDVSIRVYQGPEIYVPKAFTPNNDAKNDVFKPILIGIKELKYFAVFSRWGQLVFKTSEANKGWDGTLNGIRQNPGAFVWTVDDVDFNGHAISKKETVILIS